jgi:hypothetical protein
MALRDQPYFPLYVRDFLTDEKLAECSAQATGVYIRLLCLMHKSEHYGKILLRQKSRQIEQQTVQQTDQQTKQQNGQQIEQQAVQQTEQQNGQQEIKFAAQIAKHLPYELPVVEAAIIELVAENVLFIEGDFLCQKRMIRDGELSIKRSKSGRKGAEATKETFKDFARAKLVANTANANANANANEYDNENEEENEENEKNEKSKKSENKLVAVQGNGSPPDEIPPLGHKMQQIFQATNPTYPSKPSMDMPAMTQIALFFHEKLGGKKKRMALFDSAEREAVETKWRGLADWYKDNGDNKSLDWLNQFKIQQIYSEITNGKFIKPKSTVGKPSGKFVMP